ncbi:MAG: FKBP-type peptidyl-prolyl cis-trans isomerase [Verrucomicrobia bacterium]|nr:FKBP-type peptidyl-prolyl cis-trans isomerase [Verrucomicrobiota bacterium]
MKWLLFAASLCVLPAYAQDLQPSGSPQASSSASAPSASAGTSTLKDDKDKLSYSLGVDIARTLQRLDVDLNQQALVQGLSDILAKRSPALNDQEIQQTLQGFQKQLIQKQQAAMAKKQTEMKDLAEKNKAEGKKFLDENAKKAGVKTLPSGLQYKVEKDGNGPKPKDTDVVETNYRGTLTNGQEFDSSEKNGGPVSFPVNGVIKGWTEALKLMPVGSKWKLYIPSDLAYGDEGAGDTIQPGSTLVFDVELLGIKKEAAGAAAAGGAAAAAAQPGAGGTPEADSTGENEGAGTNKGPGAVGNPSPGKK